MLQATKQCCTRGQQQYLRKRLLSSSTTVLEDFFDSTVKGEAVQNVVKNRIIETVTDSQSPIWSENNPAQSRLNGIDDPVSAPFPHLNGDNETVNGVNGVRYQHAYKDPLDEWLLKDAEQGRNKLDKDQLNLHKVDPFELTRNDMVDLTSGLRDLVSQAGHPLLASAAEYFFAESSAGKKVRPLMVLLLSHAMNAHQSKASNGSSILKSGYHQRSDLFDAQRRLAEIAEMIHTASLFHDDVIDKSELRRGKPSANAVFGNKMAILAGDFLLARASICLARLRDVEVVETMSTIIEHLVRGEVMQTKSNLSVETYLKKNYYKTASLMANSCKSAAILGNYSSEVVEAAYSYGKHVGVAFQLVDDILDFEGNVDTLGKPVCADLSAGLATAPVLYAAEEFSELKPMVTRKFRGSGEVDQALKLIMKSQGIARTKDLARAHADHAIKSLMILKQSEFRDALIHLAYKVVNRTT